MAPRFDYETVFMYFANIRGCDVAENKRNLNWEKSQFKAFYSIWVYANGQKRNTEIREKHISYSVRDETETSREDYWRTVTEEDMEL